MRAERKKDIKRVLPDLIYIIAMHIKVVAGKQ